MRSNTQHVV